ncbi:acyltransferase domain-containing protein [Burkholderia pyrrocinia]|uniref:type I polyketide synthase n=1 Tax=Burkholderia sp. IT-111MI5 TaxID=3026439 RepID=UPI002A288FEF|nr:acyltransferase domain-containing protein [Burkholderia pyrrocinia]EKS9897828.1 acyltransferase domain-containing protein [Burkholderia pyrrocinia]EKS9910387.1 acyltransferase domain-containing protein [Burkholderia pyrrocinia]
MTFTDCENHENDIAIVAMECRIPGADNVDKLWELLLENHCTIQDLSDDQLADAGVLPELRSHPDYVKRAAVLEDVDKFDAAYFDMSAREADVLDVQQRMMLEAAVTLLNRGNVDPARVGQRIGVFAGSGFSSYLFGVLEQVELVDALGEMLVRHGNDKDFLANRVSYKLNLQGPSVNVQTSCSTGLVAVHSAVQSLLLGECDQAIAGSVYIRLPQHAGYKYQADGVLSPDGLCRPFDADARGTIFTNGLGLVLLKRLRDAVEDGDDIVAVIAGSAINNDGSKKVGFTAPSVGGQIDVLADALAVSGISPGEMQFIEAHGTGTVLGDPIEIEAIRQAYGPEGTPCAIGSLKGHFGHFNIAAGIIGLIKTALVLRNGIVPSTLHLQRVNPQLELDGSRFFVADRQLQLDMSRTRYAAVSAFGMGGTNCHLVMRSAPPVSQAAPASASRAQLFTFSARSDEALERMAGLLADQFEAALETSIADAAYTSRVARTLLPVRGAVVARHASEAATRLRSRDFPRSRHARPPLLAFVFGGQGTQRLGMGRALAAEWPAYKEHLEHAVHALDPTGETRLHACLWQATSEAELLPTEIAQPLIFAVEYALAQALINSGLRPDYLMGHSLGEVVAASVSGVFDLETAGALVAARARVMAACEAGAMLSVEHLEPFRLMLDAGLLALAAHNSPRQYVLSGSLAIIEEAEALARARGLAHQRLKTSHAFHSPMMSLAARTFLDHLREVNFGIARTPIVSNITGRLLTEYEYRNPVYWSDHLVRTVQFAASVDTLVGLGVRHFIEIGHGHAMGNLLRGNLRESAAREAVIVPAMASIDDEYAHFLEAVALGWTRSPDIDIEPHVDSRRKISLPVYPFARDTHWVQPVIGFQPRRQGRSIEPEPVCPSCAELSGETSAATDGADANGVRPANQTVDADQSNPVEGPVAGIYQTFLGGTELSTELSFFELGGNSLLAIQLVNRLRETFEVEIPLRSFYEHSSIAAISREIARQLLQESASV